MLIKCAFLIMNRKIHSKSKALRLSSETIRAFRTTYGADIYKITSRWQYVYEAASNNFANCRLPAVTVKGMCIHLKALFRGKNDRLLTVLKFLTIILFISLQGRVYSCYLWNAWSLKYSLGPSFQGNESYCLTFAWFFSALSFMTI